MTESTASAGATKRGINFRKLTHRTLVATVIWLIVSGISIYVAWRNASDSDDFRWKQYLTQVQLKSIADSISAYRQKFGVPPRSLSDLVKFQNDFSPTDMERPVDAWHNPMIVSTNTTNFVVTSYGRDGKPGGIGFDYDLTTENPNPTAARPTFQQFLDEPSAKAMILSCVICGGFAGLLTFLTIKIPELNRSTIIKLACKFTVMLLAAVFMAAIIAGLHIPVHSH